MLLDKLNPDSPLGQFLYQTTQIIQIAGQTIHAVHNNSITLSNERKQRLKFRPLGIFTGCLIGENLIKLSLRILVEAADTDIPYSLTVQNISKN